MRVERVPLQPPQRRSSRATHVPVPPVAELTIDANVKHNEATFKDIDGGTLTAERALLRIHRQRKGRVVIIEPPATVGKDEPGHRPCARIQLNGGGGDPKAPLNSIWVEALGQGAFGNDDFLRECYDKYDDIRPAVQNSWHMKSRDFDDPKGEGALSTEHGESAFPGGQPKQLIAQGKGETVRSRMPTGPDSPTLARLLPPRALPLAVCAQRIRPRKTPQLGGIRGVLHQTCPRPHGRDNVAPLPEGDGSAAPPPEEGLGDEGHQRRQEAGEQDDLRH